jgi:hypothetical protein
VPKRRYEPSAPKRLARLGPGTRVVVADAKTEGGKSFFFHWAGTVWSMGPKRDERWVLPDDPTMREKMGVLYSGCYAVPVRQMRAMGLGEATRDSLSQSIFDNKGS